MAKEQEQKESSKRRTRRAGKLFPYYDVDASVFLANEIKKGGVDKLEEDVLAKALGHKTTKSGAFLAKATSARHYGLVVDEKDKQGKKFWRLTELGKK